MNLEKSTDLKTFGNGVQLGMIKSVSRGLHWYL